MPRQNICTNFSFLIKFFELIITCPEIFSRCPLFKTYSESKLSVIFSAVYFNAFNFFIEKLSFSYKALTECDQWLYNLRTDPHIEYYIAIVPMLWLISYTGSLDLYKNFPSKIVWVGLICLESLCEKSQYK